MERGAEGLFLDQDAPCCSCEVVHVGDNTVERGGSFRLVDAAVGPGDLQPVAAGDGEGGGAEQRADAVDRRPEMIATRPSSACDSRSISVARRASTRTASGRSCNSTSVPSKSRNSAASRNRSAGGGGRCVTAPLSGIGAAGQAGPAPESAFESGAAEVDEVDDTSCSETPLRRAAVGRAGERRARSMAEW